MAAGSAVRVEGADRLAATLTRAAHQLGNLQQPSAKAGDVLLSRARDLAPRRSGRLAASVNSSTERTGVTVGSALVYAPPIHWGWAAHGIAPNPFLVRALTTGESQVVDVYAQYVDTTLQGVKGK